MVAWSPGVNHRQQLAREAISVGSDYKMAELLEALSYGVPAVSFADADYTVFALEFQNSPKRIGSMEAVRTAKGRIGYSDRVNAQVCNPHAGFRGSVPALRRKFISFHILRLCDFAIYRFHNQVCSPITCCINKHIIFACAPQISVREIASQ